MFREESVRLGLQRFEPHFSRGCGVASRGRPLVRGVWFRSL